MAMATRLKWYLDSHDVEYEVLHHTHTNTSIDTARSAQVPSGRLAKGVLLEDERGYVLAIIPASCRLRMDLVERELGRHLELASEAEISDLFDGEIGAIPPVGVAYNIPTAIDDSLLRLPDLYFEAGDHEDLVHLSSEAFGTLLSGSLHGRFSQPH